MPSPQWEPWAEPAFAGWFFKAWSLFCSPAGICVSVQSLSPPELSGDSLTCPPPPPLTSAPSGMKLQRSSPAGCPALPFYCLRSCSNPASLTHEQPQLGWSQAGVGTELSSSSRFLQSPQPSPLPRQCPEDAPEPPPMLSRATMWVWRVHISMGKITKQTILYKNSGEKKYHIFFCV